MSNENNDGCAEGPTRSHIFEDLKLLPGSDNPEDWLAELDLCFAMLNDDSDAFCKDVCGVEGATPEAPKTNHSQIESGWGVEGATPEAPKTNHNQIESNERSPMRRRRSGNTQCTSDTSDIGESSYSRQQPKSKKQKYEKIIMERSVGNGLKVVNDAFKRQEDIDNLAYFKVYRDWKKISWRMWPDLKGIMGNIDKIKSDYSAAKKSGITTTEEAEFKRRLVEEREKLEKLKDQQRKESIKEKALEAIFTDEGVSMKTQREAISAAYPSIFWGETATDGPAAAVQDQGTSQTQEQSQAAFSSLVKEVYAPDNKKVEVSDFQGLKDALEKTTWGKIPDYLESIATKVKMVHGEDTEFSHNFIRVLVCAAIKEMEDTKVKNLNPVMLKKWGATLNMAKLQGFQVDDAVDLLNKNLYAYALRVQLNIE